MGFLRLFGVPEGMTAAEARKLQKLEARGIAAEASAEATTEQSTAVLSDGDDIEVTG